MSIKSSAKFKSYIQSSGAQEATGLAVILMSFAPFCRLLCL